VHAVPGGDCESQHADRGRAMGCTASGGTVAGDARRLYLRIGPGRAQSRGLRDQVLSERSELEEAMNAITRFEREEADASSVTFLLDGRPVTARQTDTLIEIADREGVQIPRLCYKPGMDAVGNCRSCMVEIKGERVLAASCCRFAQAGMQVTTDSARARKAQQMVIELLQSDMPEKEYTRHNEVDDWAARLDVGKPRFAPRPGVAPDLTHAGIAVHLDACIQCTRCLRACRDEQVNDVIGLAFRGQHAKIVFDMC